MRFLPRHWIGRNVRYRLSVMGVCIAYALTALEIPLPVAVHKDASQPFPCQDHPCGCRTAEQCWAHCCCFTPEERWAWARAHNVEPPAYAEKPTVRSSAQGWNTVKLRDRDATAAKRCCQAKTERASCCRPKAECCPQPSPPVRGRIHWAPAMDAWRCQGYSTLWVNAGAVLPAAPQAAYVPDASPPASVSLPLMHADTLPAIPPDPPPRLSLV